MEEVLDYFRSILGIRLLQMALERGDTPRHKQLIIDGLSPDLVFDKLQAVLSKSNARGKHI
jgi:uncharacterized protein YggU (UPF0235/DUF167 family)